MCNISYALSTSSETPSIDYEIILHKLTLVDNFNEYCYIDCSWSFSDPRGFGPMMSAPGST